MKKLLFIFTFIFLVFPILFQESLFSQYLTLDDIYDAIPPIPLKYTSEIPTTDPTGQVKLITKNQEAWFARWAILENAKKSITMTYFIYEKDVFGKSLIGLLFKKAREGLKIKIMADARGTKALVRSFFGKDYLQKLAKYPNVKIRTFNPLYKAIPKALLAGLKIKDIIASNHDKIIIVDDEWAIIGGRNVSKNYFASFRDDDTVYRDSDVVIKSHEIAKVAQIAFDEEFDRMRNYTIKKDILFELPNEKKNITDLDIAYEAMVSALCGIPIPQPSLYNNGGMEELLRWRYCKELLNYPSLASYMNFIKQFYAYFKNAPVYKVKILDKHASFGDKNEITSNLIKFIDTCQDEIIIQNPYVVITEKMWAALKRASERGVKIIIHTNSPVSTDSLLTQAIFIQDWKKVLKDMPTCRIFVMKNAHKLHAKVFVFDKQISVVGTYNMDYVSQDINSEVVSVINSKEFARLCREKIMEDIEKYSVEYKIALNPDGSIEVIYGPSNHCSEALLKKIELLGKIARFFRKMI